MLRVLGWWEDSLGTEIGAVTSGQKLKSSKSVNLAIYCIRNIYNLKMKKQLRYKLVTSCVECSLFFVVSDQICLFHTQAVYSYSPLRKIDSKTIFRSSLPSGADCIFIPDAVRSLKEGET